MTVILRIMADRLNVYCMHYEILFKKMNRTRFAPWNSVKRHFLEILPLNTRETETLEQIYETTMESVREAAKVKDWEVMARLLELASDLAWRMKARLE